MTWILSNLIFRLHFHICLTYSFFFQYWTVLLATSHSVLVLFWSLISIEDYHCFDIPLLICKRLTIVLSDDFRTMARVRSRSLEWRHTVLFSWFSDVYVIVYVMQSKLEDVYERLFNCLWVSYFASRNCGMLKDVYIFLQWDQLDSSWLKHCVLVQLVGSWTFIMQFSLMS